MYENLEKRIAFLENKLEEMDVTHLDRSRMLSAILIEVRRLQKLNELNTEQKAIRQNAKCIAKLGQVFIQVIKSTKSLWN